MNISFKIATMRLVSSGFSNCKMVVIYPWLEYHVEDKQGTSLNDVIEQKASGLSNLHRYVIVSAMIKFEKQLLVAAKFSMEAKIREVASWDKHALWKNCRDTFESLKDHLLGRNKEYVDKSLDNGSLSC